ncbi:MAG TPA: glycosyltransferase, partial [Ilumatobacteraceae bacterium]
SESYIGDELDALRRNGIDVALSREMPAWGGGVSRVPGPIHESLEDGIAAHDPDLVLVHWGQFAISIRDRLVAARMPYAVRTHSFDGGLGAADLIDEWCVGVWTPPGIDLAHPSAHQLATLIVDPPDGVADDELRTGRLLSLSAALPKKGWPVLLDAVAMLPDTDLDVYMALTDGFPDVPETVMTLARERGLAIDLRVDVPFDVAQDAVRRAGAIVYAIRGDQHIGQPRSVIEAALAGTPLVVPEHPMFTALLGRTCHTYRRDDPRSLAAAIDDALHRPHPLGARRDLALRVAHGHASQAVFADWADSLTDAFVDWRRVRRDGRLGAVTSWWSSELRRRLAI